MMYNNKNHILLLQLLLQLKPELTFYASSDIETHLSVLDCDRKLFYQTSCFYFQFMLIFIISGLVVLGYCSVVSVSLKHLCFICLSLMQPTASSSRRNSIKIFFITLWNTFSFKGVTILPLVVVPVIIQTQTSSKVHPTGCIQFSIICFLKWPAMRTLTYCLCPADGINTSSLSAVFRQTG